MVWEIWPNVDQVDLFGQEAESREKYPALEDELYKLMQEDPYFSSLPEGLTREDIKLLDTLSFEREFGGMHHSADEVDAFFDQWVKSLSLMHALVKSVLTSCTEYRAKAKALAKALEQEKKAEEAQKKRDEKKAQSKAAREKKKRDAEAAAAANAENANQGDQGDNQPVPNDPRRRQIGRAHV